VLPTPTVPRPSVLESALIGHHVQAAGIDLREANARPLQVAALDQAAKTGPEACLSLENDSRLLREHPIEQRPGDQPLLQQDLAQLAARSLLIGKGTVDFRLVEHAVRSQQDAEGLARRS